MVWVVPYNEDSITVPMKSKVSTVVKESDMMGGGQDVRGQTLACKGTEYICRCGTFS